MKTRLLTTLFLICLADAASAGGDPAGFNLSGYQVGIAAGNQPYRIGMPDDSDPADNPYLNGPVDYMVGFLVRKARHRSKNNLGLSHTDTYEDSETIYKLGLNRDRVMFKARYRF